MSKPTGWRNRMLVSIAKLLIWEAGVHPEPKDESKESVQQVEVRFGGKKLEARDWEKHALPYIVHFMTGLIASTGMMLVTVWQGKPELVVPFFGLSLLVISRQTVEFLRRGDTPGRDLGDHIRGFAIGLVLSVIVIAVVF